MPKDKDSQQLASRQSNITGTNHAMYQAESGNNPKIFVLK